MKANFLQQLGWMAAGTLALCAALPADALTLDFAGVTGSSVQFTGTGNTFTFLPGAASDQLHITTVSDGVGDSSGKLGYMNGTFTIGAITTAGPVQTAPVTGSGALVLHDGAGHDLTAGLVWNDISTVGAGGSINVTGVLNLSSITYSGGVADFLALTADGAASEVVSFQFTVSKSLTQLTADGQVSSTSFSGSITTVPDVGSTLALFGLALTGLGAFRAKRQTR